MEKKQRTLLEQGKDFFFKILNTTTWKKNGSPRNLVMAQPLDLSKDEEYHEYLNSELLYWISAQFTNLEPFFEDPRTQLLLRNQGRNALILYKLWKISKSQLIDVERVGQIIKLVFGFQVSRNIKQKILKIYQNYNHDLENLNFLRNDADVLKFKFTEASKYLRVPLETSGNLDRDYSQKANEIIAFIKTQSVQKGMEKLNLKNPENDKKRN